MSPFIEPLESRVLFSVSAQTFASDFAAVAAAEKALAGVSLKSALSPSLPFKRHGNHTGHHGAQILAALAALQKSGKSSAGTLTVDQKGLDSASISKAVALEKAAVSLLGHPTSAAFLSKVTTGETAVDGLAKSNTLASGLTNAVQTFNTALNNIAALGGSDSSLITAIQNAQARAQQQAAAEQTDLARVQSSLLTLEQDAIAAVKLIKGA